MRKSFTQTLVLVAIFGGLLAWYLVVEKKIRPDRKEAEENGKRLVQMDRDQIQEIEIQRKPAVSAEAKSGAKTQTAPPPSVIRLKKVGKDWVLIAPFEDPADSSTITALLSTLVTIKQDRVVEESPKDLAPFGLADPTLKISVKKGGTAAPEEIWVGNTTPTGPNSYIRLGNKGPIYRAADTLRTSFDKEANEFRSKTIVNIPRSDFQELEIQNSSGNIVLKKGTRDEWQLLREDAPADAAEVNKSLNTLTDLKATAFATEKATDLRSYGLQSPAVKVTVTKPKEGGKIGLWFGKVKDKTYAKREGKDTIYEVDAATVTTLQRASSEYRDLSIARFNRFDVSKLVLERAQSALEIKKDGSKWVLASDGNTELDTAKVDALLTTLQDTKAIRFLPAKDKVKEADLKLHIFETQNGKETAKVELSFAKPETTFVKVQRAGLETPFAMRVDHYKQISLRKSDLIQTPKPTEAPKAGASPSGQKPSKTG